MYYLDQQGNYYTGEKASGGISVNQKPSINHRLKEDWKTQIPDVWEFDSQVLKQKLIQKAMDDYDTEHQTLIFKYYPKYEPFSWQDQRIEATNWSALTVASTVETPEPVQSAKISAVEQLSYPWLFNACYPHGGEIEIPVVDAFATKILHNAATYKQAASTLLGKKRERISLVNSADSQEALEALL